MLLHILKVLTPEELTEVRDALGRAEWTDGGGTVGLQGAEVKRNEQLPEASPVRQALGAKILAALARNPLFFRLPAIAHFAAPVQSLPRRRPIRISCGWIGDGAG